MQLFIFIDNTRMTVALTIVIMNDYDGKNDDDNDDMIMMIMSGDE